MIQLKSVFFTLLILSLGIIFTSGGVVLAQDEVVPPKGLSGPHEVLSCDMCHGEGVWHASGKDLTVCQRCHPDQWETLSKSMHTALMGEGTIQRGDVEFKVRYCSTCHSPHNNDFLRIETQEGEVTYYTFDDFMPLCFNCHFSGAAGALAEPMRRTTIINTTTTKTNTTTTTITNTTTTTTTRTTMISMTPASLAIPVTSTLTIQGEITPAVADAEVVIQGKPAGSGSWNVLGATKTDANGEYEFVWTPTSEGNFVFKASYGDLDSGIYTVIVSGAEPGEAPGLLDMLLRLFPSPIFLLVAVVGVVVVVVVVLTFRRKT